MTQGNDDRSTTFSPTQRHVFELTLLNEVGAICASAQNADEILTRTTRLIAESLFPDNCGFLLLDRERGLLVPHESSVLTNPNVVSRELPLSTGLTGKTVRTGRPLRIGDVRQEPDYFDTDSRTCSEICLPLRVHGEVTGVINIENSQPDAFSEADERLLTAVLDVVGVTLERLHHQEQLRASEARFRRILESLPLGVFIHDGERMYYANPIAMQIMGVDSVERLYEMSPMEIVVPAYREMAKQRVETLLKNQGQLPTVETQICRLDGSIVDVEVNSLWTEFAGRSCVQVHFSDITERKRAAESLQQSQQSLKSIAEATPHWIYVFDLDVMGTTYTNRSLLRDLGHPPGSEQAERSITTFAEYMLPSEWPHLAQLPQDWQAMADGQFREDEYHMCHADGSVRSFASREVVYARRPDGTVKQILGTLTDITLRKQAELALTESEQRFRELADAIPQIVWISSADGSLTHLNLKATEYTGIGEDGLTGWSWEQVIHPDDLASTLADWRACLQDGVSRDMAFRIRRSDNTFRWHITREVPVRDSTGAITAWYGTCTDIEDLKRAEAALQDNESRFRLLFEGAADAIFWADADSGVLTHCNRAAERLLGCDRSEIIGQPQSMLHPPEEAGRYRELFQEHARRLSTAPIEVEVIRKDGRRIDVAISPSVTVIGGQRVIQGIFRDITERKQAEQTIQKLSSFREAIIRTAAEGICVCFPSSDFPFISFSVWNNRMTEITGYTLDEINRLGWYQSLYPDPDVQCRAQQRMDRMRDGDDLRAEEWKITRKDGAHRTVSISTSRVDLNGNISSSAALIQDVTDQKQAVQSLRDSERSLQFFRTLVNLTNDTFHVMDPATSRFLDVNEQACERLGYTREELLQLGVIDIEVLLPDLPSWLQKVQEIKAAGSRLLEGFHRRKDGSTFPVEINVRHVTVEQQEYLVAVVRDITERRQADMARQLALEDLRRSEERFTKLFHASPFSIIVASYPAGKIVEANDAFLGLFEFQHDEVIGRTTGDLDIWVLPGDRQRMLDSLRTHGAARNMEYLFQTKSGKRRTLVMSVEIIRLDGQEYSLAMSFDITDRKAAEAELHKTDELLRAVIQSTTDAVFVKDRQGKYLLFNEAAGQFVGVPASEVLGQDDTAFFDAAAVKIIQAHDRKVMESGVVSTAEETLTAAGISRTYLSTKAPYRDDAGNVIGVIGISRDITERKHDEKVIRESEERYRMLFELCGDAIFILDLQGNIRSANPAAADMHGYTLDELIGRSMRDLDVPVDADQIPNRMRRIQSGEILNFEVVHRRKDGTEFPLDAVASLFHIGNEPLVLAFDRDITERKRSENAIRQSLSRLQATLDATADGILVVDLDGHVVDLNPQFLAVWKFPADWIVAGQKEELISRFNQSEYRIEMLGQLQHPEAFVQRIREIYNSPEESSFDVIEFRDGSVLERVSRPQLQGGISVGRVWSFRDVSQQRQLEQQLRQSQKMEAVGQLAGGIAHDFNNLLTVINGYCDLLLNEKPQRNSWADSVQEIRDAGRRAALLTEQLLSFSRKSRVSLQVVPLNDIVTHAEKLLRRLIRSQIELHVELDPQAGCIRADVTQLDQVLMNLAVNAKDAMPDGGRLSIITQSLVGKQILAEVSAAPYSDQLVALIVRDTGIGMTVEQSSRIFEPFFTTKEVGKGSGLGLAVVHGIVRQHGGQIHVESQPSQGTQFTVYFPAVDDAATLSPPKKPESGQTGTETILLVEDEAGVRRMTRQAMELMGYRVLEAGNGQVALEISRQHKENIDLLVTDMIMPGLSGRQVAESLRATRPEMKVIFISGYHEDQNMREMVDSLQETFLKKPFSPQELTRLMRQLLDLN